MINTNPYIAHWDMNQGSPIHEVIGRRKRKANWHVIPEPYIDMRKTLCGLKIDTHKRQSMLPQTVLGVPGLCGNCRNKLRLKMVSARLTG